MNSISQLEQYTLYVDESGDANLADISQGFPLFVLCGVLVSKTEYHPLRRAIDQVKIAFCGSKQIILHSRDIRRQVKDFAWLNTTDSQKRVDFFGAIDAVINSQKYQALAVVIRKASYAGQFGRLADNNQIYANALSALIEQTVRLLDDHYKSPVSLQLVLEQRGFREDQEVERLFQRILSRGTAQLSPAQLLPYTLTLDFKPKKANINAHQLADLLAYPIGRYVLNKTLLNPSFAAIEPHLHPQYGLLIFPNP